MKMLNKLFSALIAAGLLASCSGNNLDGPDQEVKNVDGLYLTLSISPETMTRTQTPSSITEEGQTSETKINNLLLILVDKNSTVVDYARLSTNSGSGEIKTQEDGSVIATGQFNRNNMISYLQNSPTNHDTKFYVVCNPTDKQEFSVGQNIDDFICNKDPRTYWTDNNFVMSNSAKATVSLPNLSDVQAGKYSNKNDAFEIADVTVERVVARFDYAPYVEGSKAIKENDQKYYFELSSAREDQNDGKLHISINALSLVNMGKAFYLFKRVNDTGLKANASTMFGAETKTNYVVGPYGAEKAALNNIGDDFDEYFHYAIFGSNFSPEFTSVNTIVKSENKRGTENGQLIPESNYYFWRYSLTNNLPADPKITQKNCNSTSIIFRAEITTPDADGDLKSAMNAGDAIYAHGGKLIGNYAALKTLVNKDAAHAISIAYSNAGLTDDEKELSTPNPDIDKKLVQNGKFAIYRASSNHYYCDYYYWNRHNDNLKENEMGPMEFAVVRNTIYKLAVTEIAKLGHPIIKDDDPDPLKPDTPDETSDFFMKVKLTLKKWGVRVNNIKF